MIQQGFYGYPRKNGRPGIRNYVGVFSASGCANQLTKNIAINVPNCIPFTHSQGCGQVMSDLKIVERVLINLIQNPNIGAAVIAGIGCEGVQAEKLYEKSKTVGKSVEYVTMMNEGGYENALEAGIKKAKYLTEKINKQEKTWNPLSELLVGIKCGASDTTSGLISNCLVGSLVDALIDRGASAVFGEVTEFIGAEHYLAKRCETEYIRNKLINAVNSIEKLIKDTGEDIRGGQPSEGNIRGGITTLEEKSLGAINKSGSRNISDFLQYGERISTKGLTAMDFPGREPEALTALAAAGAQLIVFSTGLGAPQGFPFVPVIKVTGNKNTLEKMRPHIDYYVKDFLSSDTAFTKEAEKLLDKVISISNGEKSKCEELNFYEPTNIWVKGPVI